jgi:hypothetical protein
MKITHFVILFALVGGATARAVPIENARLVARGDDVPLVMQLSEVFLSEATATLDAVGAHKLPYSNPSTGECQENESKVSISGLPGAFCSPSCGPATPCPKDTHFGATAEGQCVLETQGHSQPSQCALICKPGAGGCPRGASCQPIQGLGICTYPSGPRETNDDASAEEN